MKDLVAITMALTLQFAVAPLCLCHGMIGKQDSKAAGEVHSCCEKVNPQSGDDTRKPCPHCDQADSMNLSAPAKGVSAPDQPVIDSQMAQPDPIHVAVPGSLHREIYQHGAPPPVPAISRSVPELFGVFLI